MITAEEIRKIITEIFKNGITLNIASYIVLGIIAFIASYLGGYARRKGENVATKKDIKKITDEIESVKHEYAKELHIHQIRYEKEFELLSELSEKIVKLRDSAKSLRPSLDYPVPEDKKERFKAYSDASLELYDLFENKKPFIPEHIYTALRKFDHLTWKESISYKISSPDPKDRRHYDPEYWEKSTDNAKKIEDISEEILEQIRNRVKKWETLDF